MQNTKLKLSVVIREITRYSEKKYKNVNVKL